ncbi:hypothetical protein [Acetobacterium malicum]|uniref:hypothetical protein n=1 Tax=Acetobacterium malicum TaxID=52692 RepID=UPI000478DCE8|nr:hypothetical protein [Acetobacterium dehalogenans]
MNNITELKTMVQIEVNEETPCLLAKTKRLVDILNEIQPNDYWHTDYFHAPFNEKDMKPILIKGLHYLERFQKYYIERCYEEKIIAPYYTREMMGRQFMVACKALMAIETGHYKDAYHRLWYCVSGHGIYHMDSCINLNEYLIYRSLISCFIQSLLKQEQVIKKASLFPRETKRNRKSKKSDGLRGVRS